ncbi:hypothetical protein BD779DRAFT_1477695 [Infundibulicybe gibba]|nr:hypothetical protein BD779DRAFT_1477695 [Infundibulicybe gibba]
MFPARQTRVADSIRWLKKHNHWRNFIGSGEQPTPALVRCNSDVEGLGGWRDGLVAQVAEIENVEAMSGPDVDYSDMPPLEDPESRDEGGSSSFLLSYAICYALKQ